MLGIEVQHKCLSFPKGYFQATETKHDADSQHLRTTRLEALSNPTHHFDYCVKNNYATFKSKIMKVLTLQPKLFYTIIHCVPVWGRLGVLCLFHFIH